ncbi:hypothetical protein GCM10009678_92740 [Actinomadura kijaniata]|uniref:Uncharacterized protein n=1 Tax=Actinomadura namibiensis TaxID=182080 RepID=A0A7W3LKJ4_ACTNM|nr:hypothetical protein [Actinomadura namibiensis]MBA8949833.1 hypothetical protein [Actinomadura namibiensis]
MNAIPSSRRAALRWSLAACAVTAAPLAAAVPAPAAHATAHATAAVAVTATSVSPDTITSGQEAIQTVTLAEPAPAGGVKVTVHPTGQFSDLTYLQATRNEVTVPAGERSVSFPIRVENSTTASVRTLKAYVGSSSAVTSLTVNPVDPREQAVTSFTVDRPDNARAAVEGSTVTGTVKIKSPAPVGGLAVDVREVPYESSAVHGPAYVVVPAGGTSATFRMTATAYDFPRSVTLRALLGPSDATTSVLGVPKHFSIAGLDFGRVRRGPQNNPQYGGVGIGEWWHPFGAVVKFTTDNPKVTVTPEVDIPASHVGALFRIEADASVPVGTKVRITANWVLGPVGPATTEVTVVD